MFFVKTRMVNLPNLPSYHRYFLQLLSATHFSYVRSSPITPTLFTGNKIAPACHTLSYKPASLNPLIKTASTSCKIRTFSGVISPRILIANPGPGKG